VSVRVARLEGQLVLAAHVAGAAKPSYFILLEWQDGKVASIRDFRYVKYIANEAELEELT
jgi:RNA polymerase sigma-70 factor (ECF subfamily)